MARLLHFGKTFKILFAVDWKIAGEGVTEGGNGNCQGGSGDVWCKCLVLIDMSDWGEMNVLCCLGWVSDANFLS